MKIKTDFTYLATPYTAGCASLKHRRFLEATRKAAELMEQGEKVFCPIAHSHPIDYQYDKPKNGDFWLDQDFAILSHASTLKVLMIPGWMESHGVAREIRFAIENGIPIEFIDP